MFTETLFKIPFSVIGRCSLVPASHWLQGKCARINLSQAAYGRILQNHMRLPVCKCQNRPFRIFEAGYWKGFKISNLISKEQAKKLSLILSPTKKPKLLKPSANIQKVTIYYNQNLKNIHLTTQSL